MVYLFRHMLIYLSIHLSSFALIVFLRMETKVSLQKAVVTPSAFPVTFADSSLGHNGQKTPGFCPHVEVTLSCLHAHRLQASTSSSLAKGLPLNYCLQPLTPGSAIREQEPGAQWVQTLNKKSMNWKENYKVLRVCSGLKILFTYVTLSLVLRCKKYTFGETLSNR